MTSHATNTIKQLRNNRVVAIIRAVDRDRAMDAANAAIDGGFNVIEFTLNTPGAMGLIQRFAQRSELIIGAGTVMNPNQVSEAVDAGARFIVSPHTDCAVIEKTLAKGSVSIPAAFTPNEMLAARRAGAHVVKLFPAPADIGAYVRQILGPLPDMPIFPTAGVSPENFMSILNAGAMGVGFVSSLFRPDEMDRRDFAAIRNRAASIIAALNAS